MVAAAAEGDRHRRRHHGRECPKPDTSYIPRQHVMMCGNVIPRPMVQPACHAWDFWHAGSTTPLYSILCCYGTARRRHQFSRGVILGHEKFMAWNLNEIFCRDVHIDARDFQKKIQTFLSMASILFYFLKSGNWKNRKQKLVRDFSNP